MERMEGINGQFTYYWREPAGGGPSPLLVCLAGSQEDALSCGTVLESQGQDAALAVIVVPGPADEGALEDQVYALEQLPSVDSCRVTLTGSAACSGRVWRLASQRPRWFAGACVVGGYGDPYEARALKDVPLRVIVPQEEPSRKGEGKILAGADVLAAGIRVAGGSMVETPAGYGELSPEDAWKKAFSPEGGSVAWMLGQNRRTQFVVEWLRPGVWRIDDFFAASCYLVEGREKALLIDTTMGEGDLAGLASSLTPLPVEVAITHPHGDHMRDIQRFSKVYLHQEDLEALKANPSAFPAAVKDPSAPLPELVPLWDQSVLDLGGGVTIEALELPGHTPHSMVFVDDVHQCFFTGDAMGSGDVVLLICYDKDPTGTLTRYREKLQEVLSWLPRLENYAWLGGHGLQENACDPRHQQDYLQGISQWFDPLRPQTLRDMIALCGSLLSGGVSWQQKPGDPEAHARQGSAGINFRIL